MPTTVRSERRTADTAGVPRGRTRRTAPGPRRRDDLRGLSYEEGRQVLSPQPEGIGVPSNQDEAVRLAQRSVESASLSATLEEGRTVHKDRSVEVVFEAGARLTASLDPGGLHFSSDPGVLLKVRHAPDLRITHIRWDFDEARFDCSATANWFDILGIIGAIGERKVEQVLNARLKPLLPEAVRRPGYRPTTDPNLAGTIADLSRVFEFASRGPGGGRDRTAPGSGGHAEPLPGRGTAGTLKDPSAFVAAHMPEDLRVPLSASGLELVVAKGAPFFLSAQARGRLDHPVVQRLSLRAEGQGIVVRPSSGAFRAFKELHLKGVTIRHGGTFEFDYDLSAEELGEGLLGLVALLGLAAGRDVGPIPEVRLREVRSEIDARLQKEVPPRFRAFLKQYDRLVPGVSLLTVFGA